MHSSFLGFAVRVRTGLFVQYKACPWYLLGGGCGRFLHHHLVLCLVHTQ